MDVTDTAVQAVLDGIREKNKPAIETYAKKQAGAQIKKSSCNQRKAIHAVFAH